jgi:hypothetical protein
MSRATISRAAALGAVLACLIAASASAMPAGAVAGPTAPARLMYRCTVAATDLGSTIRVVYRLTSNGQHDRWHVRMWDQGTRFFADRVVAGAGGDFRVKGIATDHHGVDHLRVSARRLGAGPTCRVTLTP